MATAWNSISKKLGEAIDVVVPKRDAQEDFKSLDKERYRRMADVEPLRYTPLPESDTPLVRLVRLLPGKDLDPIKVLFDTSKLDVEYEALSYCWGDASLRTPIACNGYRLEVTQNLESALRDLRHFDTTRVLWIDAISINQDDLTEREQQVGVMGEIFRSARRTVVWLGQTFEGNKMAFKMLKRLNDMYLRKTADGSFDYKTILYRDEQPQDEDRALHPTEKEVVALLKLLKQP
jgi:hypothetical protein